MSRKDIVFTPKGVNLKILIKPDNPITLVEITTASTGKFMAYGLSYCRPSFFVDPRANYQLFRGIRLALKSALNKLDNGISDSASLQIISKAREIVWHEFNQLYPPAQYK